MTSSDSEQANVLEQMQLEITGDETARAIEAQSVLDVSARELQHGDELVFPLIKSVVLQYEGDPASPDELRLFYADKEIAFDDPAQFAFGEALAKQSRFVACEAMGWAGGDWPSVKEMLEALIEAEVLSYADDIFALPMKVERQDRESPLPPSEISEPPLWDDDGRMMAFFTGDSLEVSRLEMTMPIFRVIHMYMDRDGRQIGEANVFPLKARMDIPTEWKTCTYEGTRYQPDLPMNATALRAMRAHWREMMGVILKVREAYLKRFPEVRHGWTVAHMERMNVVVLCLAAYMLMRRDTPVSNGDLHPVLSSLFRVTDGLRLTMHQMLFVPKVEPMLPPDTPMTADVVWDYANRHHSFHSEHGVCAGPPFMIKEFLSVVFDGIEPAVGTPTSYDPAVQAAIDHIDQAFEYAMLGLESFAILFSHWPEMADGYDRLYAIMNAWNGERSAKFEVLRKKLEAHHIFITTQTYLSGEEWRAKRLLAYEDMHDQCHFAITGAYPERTFRDLISENDSEIPGEARTALQVIFEHNLDDMADPSLLASQMAASVAHHLREVQNRLIMAEAVQSKINALLGRPTPKRRHTIYDIGIYLRLLGSLNDLMPVFADELRAIFGIHLTLTADEITVSPTDPVEETEQSQEFQAA